MPFLGFETIGNATIIVHDGRPLLVTDPWIEGSPYFGSWTLSHVIPPEQRAAILACELVWFSHGHPDHLNGDSLARFKGKKILLPDHVGGRIRDELLAHGFDVRVLRDRAWETLSHHVRVLCIADYNQDAVLLIDVNGRLLINLNDASDRGWGGLVHTVARGYETSFPLSLAGYGDSDMINFVDEQGKRDLPPLVLKRTPIGHGIARATERFGATFFIPFSSMHRYQRADSVWANAHVAELGDYAAEWRSTRARLLPAFVRFDCVADRHEPIDPPRAADAILPPEAFGDHWSDMLERGDRTDAERYFRAFHALAGLLDFVNLRVGGQDFVIPLDGPRTGRGVTFEAPRHSLMASIRGDAFDDMLIGNFMRTTLHGPWPAARLQAGFNVAVTKYGDNGRARTDQELRAYFAEYRKRGSWEFVRHRLELRCKDVVRGLLPEGSRAFRAARAVYRVVR